MKKYLAVLLLLVGCNNPQESSPPTEDNIAYHKLQSAQHQIEWDIKLLKRDVCLANNKVTNAKVGHIYYVDNLTRILIKLENNKYALLEDSGEENSMEEVASLNEVLQFMINSGYTTRKCIIEVNLYDN